MANPADDSVNSRPPSRGENHLPECNRKDVSPKDEDNPAGETSQERVLTIQSANLRHHLMNLQQDQGDAWGHIGSNESDYYSDSSDDFSDDDCNLRYEYVQIENEGKVNKDQIKFFSKSARRLSTTALVTSIANPQKNVVRVDSAPVLSHTSPDLQKIIAKRISSSDLVIGGNRCEGGSGTTSAQPTSAGPASGPASNALLEEDPRDVYSDILKKRGLSSESNKGEELTKFFIEMGEENITGYTMDKVTAVRNEDIQALRHMHSKGETMQVCNQFGESIIHSACRRGLSTVLRFLVEEACVSLAVKDDYGKTPAHDACWTIKPNFEVMKIVVTTCPDLLLVADKRGSTPLDYTQRKLWGEWCKFLKENEDILIPKLLRQELKVGEKRKAC